MAYINGKETTMQYINGKGVMFAVRPPKIAGLFDENDTLIASWDELVNTYGMDVEKDYTKSTYNTDKASPYYVLTKKSKLAKGKKLVIGSKVTSIGDHTFRACTSLTSIEIPNSVKSIGDVAFYDCTSLKSIVIPNSVKKIGDVAFEGCTSLKDVYYTGDISGWMGINFSGDPAFNGVKLYFNNELVTELEIPDSVTSMGWGVFKGCASLKSVKIGNSLPYIASRAFCNCTSLKSVVIGNSVTSISSSAFEGCTSLVSINIPDTVTSIWESAFASCISLKSVKIPDSVTTLDAGVFQYCSSLTSLTIGVSVNCLRWRACMQCIKLENINYTGTTAQWKAITKQGGSSHQYGWNYNVPATYVQCTDGQVAL